MLAPGDDDNRGHKRDLSFRSLLEFSRLEGPGCRIENLAGELFGAFVCFGDFLLRAFFFLFLFFLIALRFLLLIFIFFTDI